MLNIPSRLVRQFRALLRRGKYRRSMDGFRGHVLFQCDSQQLSLRALTDALGLEVRVPCADAPQAWLLPLDLLDDVGSTGNDFVTLAASGDKYVSARWTERGIPQVRDYELLVREDLPAFPTQPTAWQPVAPHFWSALQAALSCVDPAATRYALGCLQLRGSQGQIAATNGKELLIQGGFSFPWTEDLLIPAQRILGCADLAKEANAQLAQLDDWLVINLSSWTIWNKINRAARFPKTQDIVPSPLTTTTRLCLHEADARFLNDTLDSLPGQVELHHPITVELNGQVVLRGQAGPGTTPTELLLSRSRREGEPVRLVTNREYLARAVRLGFREIAFTSSQAPAVCRDDNRTYLWALLTPESAIRAAPENLQIDSAQADSLVTPKQARKPAFSRTAPYPPTPIPMKSVPKTQPEPTTEIPNSSALVGSNLKPIEAATALRGSLRDALDKTTHLLAALKHQKKQSRLMQSTLASLKQLQEVA